MCFFIIYYKNSIRIQLLPFIAERFLLRFLSTYTCRVVYSFESVFMYSDLLMMQGDNGLVCRWELRLVEKWVTQSHSQHRWARHLCCDCNLLGKPGDTEEVGWWCKLCGGHHPAWGSDLFCMSEFFWMPMSLGKPGHQCGLSFTDSAPGQWLGIHHSYLITAGPISYLKRG